MPTVAYKKKKALEQTLAQLLEEQQIANDQLGRPLSAAEKIRIKRELAALEKEIEAVNSELKGRKSVAGPSIASPQIDTGKYNRAVVRDLLLRAFTAVSFRRLFLYTSQPDLHLLSQEFAEGDGLAKMVDKAIEQCETKDLLPDLLREVKQANPRMYARFRSRLCA